MEGNHVGAKEEPQNATDEPSTAAAGSLRLTAAGEGALAVVSGQEVDRDDCRKLKCHYESKPLQVDEYNLGSV